MAARGYAPLSLRRLEVSPSNPAKSWVRHCLQTCRSFFFALHRYFRRIDLSFCTSPIDITEVNLCNTVVLLWVIEDQSHQKWVMKKKELETTGLKYKKRGDSRPLKNWHGSLIILVLIFLLFDGFKFSSSQINTLNCYC